MGVNLNALRIQSDSLGKQAPKAGSNLRSALRLFIAFCLGVALAYVFLRPGPRNSSTTGENPHMPRPNTSGKQSGEPYFTAGGWIEAPFPFPVTVSPLTEGRLDELLVWEGQRIEKGSVVAKLYQRDFRNALQLAEAKAAAAGENLAKLRAGSRPQEIEKARAEMQEAQARAETAKKVFLRSQELLKSGAVSKERAESDEGIHLAAAARLSQAVQVLNLFEAGSRKEDIALAEAELHQAQAELEIAKTNLEYANVYAPVSGVVLHRFVSVGDRVSQEKPLLTIYDPAQLQMRVDVTQSNIAQVFTGQEVEIITEAVPDRKWKGEVLRIEPLADVAKNTITVRIKIFEPDRLLFPEMTARARFLMKREQ
jgi:multidrug resistance efflux pump